MVDPAFVIAVSAAFALVGVAMILVTAIEVAEDESWGVEEKARIAETPDEDPREGYDAE